MLAGTCGRPPAPSPAIGPRQAAPPAAPSAADLDGHWRWSKVSDAGGVRHVEVEEWHLQAEPAGRGKRHAGAGTLQGSYTRVVTFLSLDGVPFSCNHTLGYELRAAFQVQGSYDQDGAVLEEVAFEAAPSPCEPGERTLATYQGALRDAGLVLRWPGGEQTLVRVAGPTRPAALAETAPALTGAWRWQSRSEKDGEVRVEREDWALEKTATGAISGTVQRTVTVFDAAGQGYRCSRDTYYRYRDRYTVRGHLTGTRLSLSETAVEPDPHPCLVHGERHLDTAIGELSGGYVVLMWRGGRRQVLHRPAPLPR